MFSTFYPLQQLFRFYYELSASIEFRVSLIVLDAKTLTCNKFSIKLSIRKDQYQIT